MSTCASLNDTHRHKHGDLRCFVDSVVSNMSLPWDGVIKFHVCPLSDHVMSIEHLRSPDAFTQLDICKYLNGKQAPVSHLYFDPVKYPPPPLDTSLDLKKCESWLFLKRDLMNSAHESGNPIYSNGYNNTCKSKRKFKCSCSRPRSTVDFDPGLYRSTTLVANFKNSRKDGLSMARRRNVRESFGRCPFSFTVTWDAHGFYVLLKKCAGNPQHCHHFKVTDPASAPMSTRLLSNAEKINTRNVSMAACTASGRNYVFSKFKRFISKAKVAYLASSDDKCKQTSDDIARMLANFESSSEIKFTTISDVPLCELDDHPCAPDAGASVLLSTSTSDKGDVINTPVSQIPGMKGLVELARSSRQLRKIKSNQYQFISIAWTVLPVFRFFLLCPEVIWCDVTSHSNNKGFSLLTFSCRTSVDRQVVFMWLWIPNEQRLSFRWVFRHAIPALLPEHARRRVRMVMKDGDAQQRNELLEVILSLFPNSREASCGWHIGGFLFSLLFTFILVRDVSPPHLCMCSSRNDAPCPWP